MSFGLSTRRWLPKTGPIERELYQIRTGPLDDDVVLPLTRCEGQGCAARLRNDDGRTRALADVPGGRIFPAKERAIEDIVFGDDVVDARSEAPNAVSPTGYSSGAACVMACRQAATTFGDNFTSSPISTAGSFSRNAAHEAAARSFASSAT